MNELENLYMEFINNHREQLKSCLYLYYKINIEN